MSVYQGFEICLLPIKMTTTTTMMMATRAPVERVMELAELSPAAPAAVPSWSVMLPEAPCHESSVARGKYADVCDMVKGLDRYLLSSILVCVCV